ncbi:MAG: hypothetical protein V1494_04440 [Candidatus Diapherotrites archaeon]
MVIFIRKQPLLPHERKAEARKRLLENFRLTNQKGRGAVVNAFLKDADSFRNNVDSFYESYRNIKSSEDFNAIKRKLKSFEETLSNLEMRGHKIYKGFSIVPIWGESPNFIEIRGHALFEAQGKLEKIKSWIGDVGKMRYPKPWEK